MADHNDLAPVKQQTRVSTLLLGMSVAVLAGVGAYWVATNPQRQAAASEPLSVDPAELEFGEVWEDKRFAWKLTIHNQSAGDITIRDFETACGCVVGIEPKSVVVPGGGEAAVRLTMDLSNRAVQVEGQDPEAMVREVDIPFAPVLEGTLAERPVWRLRGRVRAGVAVAPSRVHLGEITRGQPVEPKRVMWRLPRERTSPPVTSSLK